MGIAVLAIGLLLVSAFLITAVLKNKTNPDSASAHITEDITSLAVDITNPLDGQVLSSGTKIQITQNVSVNGTVQFAYPVEYYVNGVIICKGGDKGKNGQLNAFCNWQAPKVKTPTQYTITVKAYATGSAGNVEASDSTVVTVK